MATVPRAALDYLTSEVNAVSAEAQAAVVRVLESIEWTSQNVADCCAIVLEALRMVLPGYTDASAQASADFYDAVREMQVGEAMGATAVSGYNPVAMERAVRAFVQGIVDGAPVEQFNRKVADRVDYEIKRAANVSVVENAARDPLHPRYARVPAGSETCGFCLMLSSFGFHYTTEEAASHAHSGCDCRVVPEFDGAGVEGYDPSGMYDRYNECLEALGGREQLRRDWNALPEEERAKRIARHGNKQGSAFDSYVNGRVASEIETRDPIWFRTGSACSVSKQSGAKPWRKEREVGDVLALNGFNVEFVREPKDSKIFDAFLNGLPYEFKIPEAYNEKTVKNQFKKSVGKGASRLLISSTVNGADESAMLADIESILGLGDFPEIREVLFVGKSGKIRRFKR